MASEALRERWGIGLSAVRDVCSALRGGDGATLKGLNNHDRQREVDRSHGPEVAGRRSHVAGRMPIRRLLSALSRPRWRLDCPGLYSSCDAVKARPSRVVLHPTRRSRPQMSTDRRRAGRRAAGRQSNAAQPCRTSTFPRCGPFPPRRINGGPYEVSPGSWWPTLVEGLPLLIWTSALIASRRGLPHHRQVTERLPWHPPPPPPPPPPGRFWIQSLPYS
jgi:hypothetical protein